MMFSISQRSSYLCQVSVFNFLLQLGLSIIFVCIVKSGDYKEGYYIGVEVAEGDPEAEKPFYGPG